MTRCVERVDSGATRRRPQPIIDTRVPRKDEAPSQIEIDPTHLEAIRTVREVDWADSIGRRNTIFVGR